MYIDLPEKRYYMIGEVAEAFKVNPSLIRYWEKEFSSLKPKKNRKGNRLFTIEDINNIKLIFMLTKEKGLTLEGAKKELQSRGRKIKDNLDIISKLENIKNELNKIKTIFNEG